MIDVTKLPRPSAAEQARIDSWDRIWREEFDKCARANPGKEIIEVTSYDSPRPEFVAGLPLDSEN